MSRKTIDIYIDDLDDVPIPEGNGRTVRFSLDDTAYEIDLADANVNALVDALAPFIAVAREVSAERSLDAVVAELKSPQMRAQIRNWAEDHGLRVAHRGRIPKEIVFAYAHQSTRP